MDIVVKKSLYDDERALILINIQYFGVYSILWVRFYGLSAFIVAKVAFSYSILFLLCYLLGLMQRQVRHSHNDAFARMFWCCKYIDVVC